MIFNEIRTENKSETCHKVSSGDFGAEIVCLLTWLKGNIKKGKQLYS